jgi:hypothetical protein
MLKMVADLHGNGGADPGEASSSNWLDFDSSSANVSRGGGFRGLARAFLWPQNWESGAPQRPRIHAKGLMPAP